VSGDDVHGALVRVVAGALVVRTVAAGISGSGVEHVAGGDQARKARRGRPEGAVDQVRALVSVRVPAQHEVHSAGLEDRQ
jgi:hypothetical protein